MNTVKETLRRRNLAAFAPPARTLLVWLVPLLMAGCQTYHPMPLPTAPDLLRTPALNVPADHFHLPGLQPHPFNTNGLDEVAVVTLAVFNNPDLKAARREAGVADAQLVEAGLLPDPQVSGSLARSPYFGGYSVGLSEDLQALITRGAAKASAKAHAQQVNLDILWQEDQVAEKAEELFIQARADGRLRGVLTKIRDLLAERSHNDQIALHQGNLTADIVSADTVALADAETNVRQLQLDASKTRHDLNSLLGLQPDTRLRLAGRGESLALSESRFHAAVENLAHRRPDLLALQAGYQSQEQRLREAILAQFPSMSAGVEQARDPVEGVNTIGLNVNVTLPLFNRNQGQIAIQQATRALLYQTYQARLDQAASQANQMWDAARIMSHQQRDLEARLAVMKTSAAAAERSFQQGNLTADTRINLELNLATEQAQAIRLEASLEQVHAALQILVGLPLDVAN